MILDTIDGQSTKNVVVIVYVFFVDTINHLTVFFLYGSNLIRSKFKTI